MPRPRPDFETVYAHIRRGTLDDSSVASPAYGRDKQPADRSGPPRATAAEGARRRAGARKSDRKPARPS
jgi:hypothetical protein